MEPLKDGFYESLSFARYLDQPRISKSVLMAHRKSAAHAKAEMDSQRTATAAMRRGTLGHTLILEPSAFDKRYTVGPVSDRRLKAWKDAEAAHLAATDPRDLITPNDHEAGKKMAAWLNDKPLIAELAREAGPVECSVFWTERVDGVELAFRARPDKLLPLRTTLVDLKTTADISDRALSATIYKYGYHLQARHYLDGLAAVGMDYQEAVIIWVESGPPFDARATMLGDEWLDMAAQELAELKRKHAACVKSGKWPGYADGIGQVFPAPWMSDESGDGVVLTMGGQRVAV